MHATRQWALYMMSRHLSPAVIISIKWILRFDLLPLRSSIAPVDSTARLSNTLHFHESWKPVCCRKSNAPVCTIRSSTIAAPSNSTKITAPTIRDVSQIYRAPLAPPMAYVLEARVWPLRAPCRWQKVATSSVAAWDPWTGGGPRHLASAIGQWRSRQSLGGE